MHRARQTILPSPPRLRFLLRPSLPHNSHPFSSDSAAASELPIPISTSPPTQESVLYVLKKLDKMPQKALDFFHCVTAKHNFSPGPSAYSLMLRILSHKDHLKDFWLFLKTLEDRGLSLDKGTYFTILTNFKKQHLATESSAFTQFYTRTVEKAKSEASIRSASKIILDSGSWDEEVERKLEELRLSLSESVVAEILREVRDCPLKALDFFRWAARRAEYKHDSVAYNAMARVLGRVDSVAEFWSMIEEMKGQDIEMDIDSYIKILRRFLKSKMMKEAVELYEFMMDGPYKPAVQDCGMLLRQISMTGSPDLELVFRVVKKYETAGYSLSKVVYDGIHRSLTSNGRFDEAEDILERMKLAGYEPDNITYSQLVHGLCKAKRLDEACKVLDEMEEGGCTPDLKTWTVLIQGHCSAGEVDKALECLTKMMGKSWDADADLLDVLVNGLCSQKRVDGAYALFVEMVGKARLRPWQATYKYLIQELLRERKLEEGLKLLGLMKSQKFPPFAEPFAPYISKFGTIEDAREFLKALSSNNYPSSTAYLNLFKSFFKEGRYSEAQDLLFKCPHHIRKDVEISKLFGSIKVGNVV